MCRLTRNQGDAEFDSTWPSICHFVFLRQRARLQWRGFFFDENQKNNGDKFNGPIADGGERGRVGGAGLLYVSPHDQSQIRGMDGRTDY